jgi:preprotein translocase subunit Sec61beta
MSRREGCRWCDATSAGLCYKHWEEREIRRRRWAPAQVALVFIALVVAVVAHAVILRLKGGQ